MFAALAYILLNFILHVSCEWRIPAYVCFPINTLFCIEINLKAVLFNCGISWVSSLKVLCNKVSIIQVS